MDRRICLQAMAAAGIAVLTQPEAAAPERLRIGLTPVILADQVAFFSRWGQYLSPRVGCDVSFVARESYQAILDLLFSGQVDAAWICGYPYVRWQNELALFAVPLYQNQPLYQSYLIRSVKSSVPLVGWGDLRGKVLAYSDPLSNSGWLVAQAQLARAGVTAGDLKRSFFAHAHRSVAEAVAAQLANAGSIDGYVWETMRQQGMSAALQTQVIWKSPLYGFPPLVTRRGAIHLFLRPLQSAILIMADDAVGRELLKALNLTGFTAGTPATFDSIRSLAETVPGSGVSA